MSELQPGNTFEWETNTHISVAIKYATNPEYLVYAPLETSHYSSDELYEMGIVGLYRLKK